MASWVRPDGRGIEAPMESRAARGRVLSDESCYRIRDMLAVLLVKGLHLSKPDAVRVLNLGAVSERQLRNRVNECPASVRDLFDQLQTEVAHGTESGLG